MALAVFPSSRLGWFDLMNSGAAGTLFTVRSHQTANLGTAFRFTAKDTQDILGVYIRWVTVSSPASNGITVSIQTIDATTGKPSGTLYDSAGSNCATVTITPSASSSWQLCTFPTPPTTGLTAGTEYAVCIITGAGGGGTTATVASYNNLSATAAVYPSLTLTSTDSGTTWVEVTQSVPNFSLILGDSTEWTPWFALATSVTTSGTYVNNATGLCIVLAAPVTISGYWCRLTKTGTPAGDVTFKLWNSGVTVVAGSTVTIDKDSVSTAATNLEWRPRLATPITLAAGTYRLMIESQSSADVSNCWGLGHVTPRSAAVMPSGLWSVNSVNISTVPPTLTDTTTTVPWLGFILDDIPAPAIARSLLAMRASTY